MERTTREEQMARGIAALGRVAMDDDGFTVFDSGDRPDAFRVWEDPHVGTLCTCERFSLAFRAGADYDCEHILAVGLWLDPPAEEVSPYDVGEIGQMKRRKVV